MRELAEWERDFLSRQNSFPDCQSCRHLRANITAARGDLGSAKGKFIRRSTARSYEVLVEARDALRAKQDDYLAHAASHSDGAA